MKERRIIIEWVDLGLQNSQNRLNFAKTQLLALRSQLPSIAALKICIISRLWVLQHAWLALQCQLAAYFFQHQLKWLQTTLFCPVFTIFHLLTYKTPELTLNMLEI